MPPPSLAVGDSEDDSDSDVGFRRSTQTLLFHLPKVFVEV